MPINWACRVGLAAAALLAAVFSVTCLYDDSDGGELTAAAGHGWFQPIEAHTRTHTTTGTPRPS